MAWTQSDLDKIRTCIASGVMQVHFADGRRVVYQSLADMLAAEQRIAAFISANATPARVRRRSPRYGRGC